MKTEKRKNIVDSTVAIIGAVITILCGVAFVGSIMEGSPGGAVGALGVGLFSGGITFICNCRSRR